MARWQEGQFSNTAPRNFHSCYHTQNTQEQEKEEQQEKQNSRSLSRKRWLTLLWPPALPPMRTPCREGRRPWPPDTVNISLALQYAKTGSEMSEKTTTIQSHSSPHSHVPAWSCCSSQ